MINICTYYELWTTDSDRTESCKARFQSYERTMEEMKNHCNWYCSRGTGSIYRVGIFNSNDKIIIERKLIYEN